MKKLFFECLLVTVLASVPVFATSVNMPDTMVNPSPIVDSRQRKMSIPINQLSDTDIATYKKAFYDSLIENFLPSMHNSLVAQGYTQESSAQLIWLLKTRLNRSQLETETWDCVSKYSHEYIMKNSEQISRECFGSWLEDFVNSNSDLKRVLKK